MSLTVDVGIAQVYYSKSDVLQTNCKECGCICSVGPVSKELVCPHVNCTDSFKLDYLPGHMRDKHRAIYQVAANKHHVKIDTLGPTVRLLCIEFDQLVILFFLKLERQGDIINFKYNVCLLEPQKYDPNQVKKLKFKLVTETLSPDITIITLIDSSEMLHYYDRSHCVNCLYQNCEKKHHENRCDWMIHNIPLNGKEIAGDIFYTITVSKKDAVSRTVQDYLKCPQRSSDCNGYMTDTIYLCVDGHSLCGRCYKSNIHQVCAVCSGAMMHKRNVTLERLVKT
nr:unnamed protein product [Callosobruchus analis]